MLLSTYEILSVVSAAIAAMSAAFAAEKFPMSEAEIGFGKTLADFDVKDVKSVRAKDFGFNPSNATAAMQKAIDSDATTVVIDAMPMPWYVDIGCCETIIKGFSILVR